MATGGRHRVPVKAAIGTAGAVLAIGQDNFPQALIADLRRSARVDHCMVFRFSTDAAADCVLDAGSIDIGRELGAAYAGHFHQHDPNRDRIFRARGGAEPILLPSFAPRMYSRSYLQLFFEKSGIVDKLATAIWFEGAGYYVNFYRVGPAGAFDAGERNRLELLAPGVTAAIARHFSALKPPGPSAAAGPLAALAASPVIAGLTAREREVCEGILGGLSSEAIAARLAISIHSVLTYRRRAYHRLGISSQSELFALVLRLMAGAQRH